VFLVKYAIAASSSNLDGSDLTVDVYSDYLGNTTPLTVAEGDYVMDVKVVDEVTSGTIYLVHDGDAWEIINLGTTPGDLFIATSPDMAYQRGTMFAFLSTTNEFTIIGAQMSVAITNAIVGA
jgi:hypothetical protein